MTTPPTHITTPSGNTTTGVTANTTSSPPISTQSPIVVCPARPCPLNSVCLNSVCQCITGSYLMNDRCVPAQVFPGQLHFRSRKYDPEMNNRASKVFQNTAAEISAALNRTLFGQSGYVRSEVVQLLEGSVRATVNNIYKNTELTQEQVDQTIQRAVKEDKFFNDTIFESTDLCRQQPFPCDVSTTRCVNTSGQAICFCSEGYISNPYSNSSCTACPSGWKAVNDECVRCSFGYSGFNCKDSSLLAVVVVSCVLGGILLILLLAKLIYHYWRRSNGKSDYSSSPYSSDKQNQPWPEGVTSIPRATTHWDAPSNIEMTEGGSTRALVNKKDQSNGLTGSYDLNPEVMKTFKGKNNSRYSYLVQGHENPYFLPGDGQKS
ncbi:protein HEG isoform X2 [Cynoglossus semilaevis]|uniref:protein HEG isoform X2 n=1 Tax=Cynoglossus semilaevis TaxID=244447 RepID=UPI0004953C8D|nr:mucin-13 isoform X2 [Cynoglossus semilaevis]